MEGSNKAQELAFKMADVFNGYTVGEVLNASEMIIISVINAENNEPLKQIAAYSRMINALSEELSAIAKKILSNKH